MPFYAYTVRVKLNTDLVVSVSTLIIFGIIIPLNHEECNFLLHQALIFYYVGMASLDEVPPKSGKTPNLYLYKVSTKRIIIAKSRLI